MGIHLLPYMCGIAGYISPKASKDEKRRIVERMLLSMKHRGPDDQGIFEWDRFCLGHRRLSIIDTSCAGHQPMANEDESLWLIANGEIYNFKSLHVDLATRGHTFRSETDTEVILHLYEEYGADLLRHLRGMFAFALLDMNRGLVFIARDRLGIKPLYYAELGDGLLFASELKAMLDAQMVPRSIDPKALSLYISFGYVPSPNTLIQGVRSLPPGHSLTYQNGHCDVQPYWTLPESQPAQFDESETPERLRALLEESIRLHSISDVPIGAFLSGGIDSTAVVGLMSRISREPVRTFSIGFEDGPSRLNELGYACLAANRFKTIHKEVIVRGADVAGAMDQIINAVDQPSFDGVNTYLVSKAAREGGITVALSGLGGDELFGGYRIFDFIPRWGRMAGLWGKIPRPARKALVNGLQRLIPRHPRSSKLGRMTDVKSALDLYALIRLNTWPSESKDIYSNIMKDALHSSWENDGAKDILPYAANGNVWRMLSELELRNYVGWRLLRDTDAMSMAHSLEVRVPLLDHKVVEFVWSLPAGWERRWGFPKKLLVAALPDILPPEIIRRSKQGFEFPLDHWMRNDLRPIVEEALSPDALIYKNMFDPGGVNGLYRKFTEKKISYETIWKFVILERWMRRYHVR